MADQHCKDVAYVSSVPVVGRPLSPSQWHGLAVLFDASEENELVHVWTEDPSEQDTGLRVEVLSDLPEPHASWQRIPTSRAFPFAAPYRGEWFGIRIRRHPAMLPDGMYLSTAFPGFSSFFGDVMTVQVRRGVAWRDDSPIYAEMLWSPGESAEHWSTHGFSNPATSAEWTRSRQVLKVAQLTVQAVGRPRGSRKGRVWDQQDYLDWYAEAGQAYASDCNRVTLKDLGEAMGVSADTVSGRLRDPAINLPWPPESYPEVWSPDA